MLASAGVYRQHEHEPSWAPGPVGRRGGCDRELHANADRRVYASQPAVSRIMRGATVGGLGLLCEQGFAPLLRRGGYCPENRRNAYATSTAPSRSSSARSSSVRPFSHAGPGASLPPIAEGGVRDGGESDGADSIVAKKRREQRPQHMLGNVCGNPRRLLRCLERSNGKIQRHHLNRNQRMGTGQDLRRLVSLVNSVAGA
jgi:hypothetical protein